MTRILLAAILMLVICNNSQAELKRFDDGTVLWVNEIPQMSKLPAEVKDMTEAEFKQWCATYNAKQAEDARRRYEAAIAGGSYQGRDGVRTRSSNSTSTRHTGVGAGGYGGPGGYTGYGASSGDVYGMPINYETNLTSNAMTYPMHWKDTSDNGGGMITIINPFCYEFWIKFTEAK